MEIKKELWGRCSRCHTKRPMSDLILANMNWRCKWCRDVR